MWSLFSALQHWHCELSADEKIPFDPIATNILLEKSGYRDTNSDGIRVCTADSWAVQMGLVTEGTPLNFELLVRREHPEEKDVAMYLDDAFADVGINVNFMVMDEPTLMTIVYSYTYDLYIGWLWSDPDPNYILSAQSRRAWAWWSDNMYHNPAYDENYTSSVCALDQAVRKIHVDNCQRTHY
ncbi:MAG: ABC transporter substrate-binding protein [Thermoplasmata archaeon]